MDKYDIILSAEEQFAREVTLGVIVTRPLTLWHSIIPGMFVIDFLWKSLFSLADFFLLSPHFPIHKNLSQQNFQFHKHLYSIYCNVP